MPMDRVFAPQIGKAVVRDTAEKTLRVGQVDRWNVATYLCWPPISIG